MGIESLKKKTKLIVGLGNPGAEYQGTRHNIGAKAVELLAKRNSVVLKNNRSFKSLLGAGDVGEEPVVLALPQTYMNLSGGAVAALLAKKGIPLKNILILCDDVDLPLGQIKCRAQGSSGGHNGLASCIEKLGSSEFSRLRLGVGRISQEGDLADYVLAPFKKEEKAEVAALLEKAVEAVAIWVSLGPETCMNRYNVKNKKI